MYLALHGMKFFRILEEEMGRQWAMGPTKDFNIAMDLGKL
jgi:hypothetical protein